MYKLLVTKVFKYKLIIDGFAKSNSLFFKTNENIVIIAYAYLLQKLLTVVEIPLSLAVSTYRKITNLPIVFRVYDSMNVVISKVKFNTKISTIVEITNEIIAKLSQRINISAIVEIPMDMVAKAIVGVFHPLSKYDPQALGTLDPLTLGNMDYTIT